MDYYRNYFSNVVLWEMERMADAFFRVQVEKNLEEKIYFVTENMEALNLDG